MTFRLCGRLAFVPVPSRSSQGCLVAGLQPCLCSHDLSRVALARPDSFCPFAACSKKQSGRWQALCSG